ncbi:MAG: MCP methyltransferase/methylesterase, CheR/CheB with PAS/PAC sensor [Nitrospira sp.]|nr:MCP methyltransferase/methylesterase, CheR/CheB with PAS/PAC sensor [Nitrospira sp.]
MNIHQIRHIGRYVRFLQENPDELDLLFREILIGVTNFFRDPEAFKARKEDVLPAVLKNKTTHSSVRVWIPGCSTGEEAYSIAIIIVECLDLKLLSTVKVQIFATDIDKEAVDRARQGLYMSTIATDVSPERLHRFFAKDDHGYRLSKTIREMVVFAPQNLIMDPPFTKLDLLCCRNLLIISTPNCKRNCCRCSITRSIPAGFCSWDRPNRSGDFRISSARWITKGRSSAGKNRPSPRPPAWSISPAPCFRTSRASRATSRNRRRMWEPRCRIYRVNCCWSGSCRPRCSSMRAGISCTSKAARAGTWSRPWARPR